MITGIPTNNEVGGDMMVGGVIGAFVGFGCGAAMTTIMKVDGASPEIKEAADVRLRTACTVTGAVVGLLVGFAVSD